MIYTFQIIDGEDLFIYLLSFYISSLTNCIVSSSHFFWSGLLLSFANISNINISTLPYVQWVTIFSLSLKVFAFYFSFLLQCRSILVFKKCYSHSQMLGKRLNLCIASLTQKLLSYFDKNKFIYFLFLFAWPIYLVI